MKTLRRKLVFKLACRVMRRRFKDAGMGPGNNPDPPQGPIVADDAQVEAAEGTPDSNLDFERSHVLIIAVPFPISKRTPRF